MKCPACGLETYWRVLGLEELSRTSYPLTETAIYCTCSGCGLVGKQTLPSSEALRDHYRSSWQYSTSRPEVCFETAAEFIQRNLTDWVHGHAVDVGSKGEALGEALERRGISLAWQKLDPHPTTIGIKEGWLGDGVVNTHAYDFLSATHVMEHVRDPKQFIEDALGLVKKLSGVVYIEVPSLELHALDAGSCDDINRDHLWHFTTHSLYALADQAGALVLACEKGHVPGWPVHRLLLAHRMTAAPRASVAMNDSWQGCLKQYERASERLQNEPAEEACLYGASHSALIFLRHFPKATAHLRLFDLYRHGHYLHGKLVERPDAMVASGLKRAFVTTRFWNAYKDISAWMRENTPSVEPISPFPGMQP